MPAGQAEPFHLALADLRDRLRQGGFRPGARIAATEVADTLQLSATPVREALSRLAGEGVLEDRRGHGFFLRVLSGSEIADLLRMSLSVLLIAQDSHRARTVALGNEGPDARERQILDPIARVERLFAGWVAEAGSRTLSAAFRTSQIQLGPVRRAEPELIPELETEAEELQALAGTDDVTARGPALRRFHLRRVALADRLAVLVYRGSQAPKV
jgi:DNA-binding GntR family transcriptional regulator